MSVILIDERKCIGCGNCVKVCPASHINLIDNKAAVSDESCLECGHCYAICPTKAISMADYDCTDCDRLGSFSQFDEDEMLLAMKSRRSVRFFKDTPVTDEQIHKIIEAGRYAPTATNMQNTSYTVITGEQLAETEKACVSLFRKALKFAGLFSSAAKSHDIHDHFFFFNAPVAILVTAEKRGMGLGGTDINAGLASAYMEIEAESMGLGVLYSGFTVINTKLNRKVKKILNLDKKQTPVACLVIGYPDIQFKRIPPRKSPKIKRLH